MGSLAAEQGPGSGTLLPRRLQNQNSVAPLSEPRPWSRGAAASASADRAPVISSAAALHPSRAERRQEQPPHRVQDTCGATIRHARDQLSPTLTLPFPCGLRKFCVALVQPSALPTAPTAPGQRAPTAPTAPRPAPGDLAKPDAWGSEELIPRSARRTRGTDWPLAPTANRCNRPRKTAAAKPHPR